MTSFKKNNKANHKKNMNHVFAYISSQVQNLHASPIICYHCGAYGHVNLVCPFRRGVNGMKAVWVRKDVLKSLTDQSGPKNSWVPRVNV